jgi:hypothetical protein
VPPGEVPPDSAQTSGLSEHQPHPRRRLTPATLTGIIAIAVFVVLFLATGVLLLLHIFGAFR